jgi:hypothetical protein
MLGVVVILEELFDRGPFGLATQKVFHEETVSLSEAGCNSGLVCLGGIENPGVPPDATP